MSAEKPRRARTAQACDCDGGTDSGAFHCTSSATHTNRANQKALFAMSPRPTSCAKARLHTYIT
jgi:hypothetical protein